MIQAGLELMGLFLCILGGGICLYLVSWSRRKTIEHDRSRRGLSARSKPFKPHRRSESESLEPPGGLWRPERIEGACRFQEKGRSDLGLYTHAATRRRA